MPLRKHNQQPLGHVCPHCLRLSQNVLLLLVWQLVSRLLALLKATPKKSDAVHISTNHNPSPGGAPVIHLELAREQWDQRAWVCSKILNGAAQVFAAAGRIPIVATSEVRALYATRRVFVIAVIRNVELGIALTCHLAAVRL